MGLGLLHQQFPIQVRLVVPDGLGNVGQLTQGGVTAEAAVEEEVEGQVGQQVFGGQSPTSPPANQPGWRQRLRDSFPHRQKRQPPPVRPEGFLGAGQAPILWPVPGAGAGPRRPADPPVPPLLPRPPLPQLRRPGSTDRHRRDHPALPGGPGLGVAGGAIVAAGPGRPGWGSIRAAPTPSQTKIKTAYPLLPPSFLPSYNPVPQAPAYSKWASTVSALIWLVVAKLLLP